MPVILGTQEAEIGKIRVQSQPREKVHETYLKKPFTKVGLVEWLKEKALSSNPNTTKLKKKKKKEKKRK
jgi:hypothetical protein